METFDSFPKSLLVHSHPFKLLLFARSFDILNSRQRGEGLVVAGGERRYRFDTPACLVEELDHVQCRSRVQDNCFWLGNVCGRLSG